jgi:hypothetical protein
MYILPALYISVTLRMEVRKLQLKHWQSVPNFEYFENLETLNKFCEKLLTSNWQGTWAFFQIVTDCIVGF